MFDFRGNSDNEVDVVKKTKIIVAKIPYVFISFLEKIKAGCLDDFYKYQMDDESLKSSYCSENENLMFDF